MEDDRKGTSALLAALGLGEVAGVLTVAPRYGGWMALWAALGILVLFIVLFGGYALYRRMRTRKRRELFTAAIEAQTTVAPRSLSDPNQRAALDKLRQKFQAGLDEYKKHDKDLYELPWYAIIGEPGSGKTEAIRHSGIDFPPGMQQELQGSGGTVNMDWWFTNQGVILDTAGRLLFDAAPAGQTPEWNEFLKLLKKSRAHCPLNGLFIVLSIESLIKDSADKISQKASRLAQQLDLIQRTLDVRFPVYLLITKCDLLTGFRDFFESIDDPLLQHQMFGWSNPDPLDARFRPDLVDEHLKSVAQRLRRRRLALLRESTARRLEDSSQFFRSPYQLGGGTPGARRAEEVESLFALPESIMRLAPRLRRYLETIFVAGEWSAKPVFLRGIFFTSSMREGKALDEAIAFATGLPLDQLPEDRSWEKDRAFFLRDLFLEKVFRERGLVTRATNTVRLIHSRQWIFGGSLVGALLIFLGFAALGYRSLQKSVGAEAGIWQIGAADFDQGNWSQPIVSVSPDNPLRFTYGGTNWVDRNQKLNLVQFHKDLKDVVARQHTVGLIFKPVSWIFPHRFYDRPYAQRVLFEASVLNPLVRQTRAKMEQPNAQPHDPAAVARHRAALLELMQLEADGILNGPGRGSITDTNAPERQLSAFLSYLTETNVRPDTNLVDVLGWTYAKGRSGWPPAPLLGGATLAANHPLGMGLTNFFLAMLDAQTNINQQLDALNTFSTGLNAYHQLELAWLDAPNNLCPVPQPLLAAKAKVTEGWTPLRGPTNANTTPLTNLTSKYLGLIKDAYNSSASALVAPVGAIINRINDPRKTRGLFQDIHDVLNQFASQAASPVRTSYEERNGTLPTLEQDELTLVKGKADPRGQPAMEVRWGLYKEGCALAAAPLDLGMADVGSQWKRLAEWVNQRGQFETNASEYVGPLAEVTTRFCGRIATAAENQKRSKMVNDYLKLVLPELGALTNGVWEAAGVAKARDLFVSVESDLASSQLSLLGPDSSKLEILRPALLRSKRSVLGGIDDFLKSKLGFPVRATSTTILDASGLAEARRTLELLSDALTNTVWNTPDTSDSLEHARKQVAADSGVLNCLVDKNGVVTPFEIHLRPYAELQGSDRLIIGVYRWLRLSDGQGTFEDSTDKPEKLFLAKVGADRPLTLNFRKTRDDAQSNVTRRLEPWWVLQQFRAGKAEVLTDSPNKWRVAVPLQDPDSGTAGNAYLDVHLATEIPFPKDWRK